MQNTRAPLLFIQELIDKSFFTLFHPTNLANTRPGDYSLSHATSITCPETCTSLLAVQPILSYHVIPQASYPFPFARGGGVNKKNSNSSPRAIGWRNQMRRISAGSDCQDLWRKSLASTAVVERGAERQWLVEGRLCDLQ